LPGPHRPDDPAYRLASLITYERAAELDQLLEKATRIDPAARISMTEFADELRACLAEPPERRAPVDLSTLAGRIGALTQAGRYEREAAERQYELSSRSYEPLRDAAIVVYEELKKHLPGFYVHTSTSLTTYVSGLQPPIPSTGMSTLAWSGTLRSPEPNISPLLAVAVALTTPHISETATDLRAAICVSGYSYAFDVIFGEVRNQPVGSALLGYAIDELSAGMHAALEPALAALAERLAEGPPSST
jgi:hypothetical protein